MEKILDCTETEKELGLNITQEQIDELKAHADDINYDVAKEREKKYVMMLCLMFMHMVFSVQKQKESFILEQHPVM